VYSWQVVDSEMPGLSPDGRWVAVSSFRLVKTSNSTRYDGDRAPVRLLDAATGQERFRFESGTEYVGCPPRFSRDGRWLAVQDTVGTLTVYDPQTGEPAARLATTAGSPRGVSAYDNFRFSPAGRLLAYESPDGGSVRLWDLTASREYARLADAHRPFEFAPDGALLVAACANGAVKVWDTATAQEKAVLRGHGRPPQQMAVSPDGKLVATYWRPKGMSKASEVKVWELRTDWAQQAPILEESCPFVSYVEFSPDGGKLVIHAHRQYHLLDLAALSRAGAPETPANNRPALGRITVGAYPHCSADGSLVVVSDQDKKEVRVLDAATAETRAVVAALPDHSNLRAFLSRDGRTLVLTSFCVDRVYAGGWRGWLGRLQGQGTWTNQYPWVTVLYDASTWRETDRFPGQVFRMTDGSRGLFTADRREGTAPDGSGQVVWTVSRWDVARRPTGRSACLAALAGLLLLTEYRVRRRRVLRARR
jgi:hypothetical protein